MTNSSSSKKHGQDQPELSGPTPKSQRTKMGKSEDNDKKNLGKKLKDVEINIPIVYGNIAFWLGKKASEYQSHKWTVYVRGASNEDLGAIIKRAVFQLHSSFNNPTRVVEAPPFELSEAGWGEFEVAITLYFHSDVCDKPLNFIKDWQNINLILSTFQSFISDVVMILKYCRSATLCPANCIQRMKTVPCPQRSLLLWSFMMKVFPDPSEAFLARMQGHPAVNLPRLPAGLTLPPPIPVEDASKRRKGDTKDHSLSQWFTNFSEADELLQLAAARQQVQAHIAKLRRQISLIDGQHQQFKSTSEQ
uniref:Protein AF-9 isogeny n=1 Tax=Cajanus cajan TaxID=3821 RepID=A0A151TMN6_CAJCA|nr:Protein AF-9 isogeny [Cajanus cajan]